MARQSCCKFILKFSAFSVIHCPLFYCTLESSTRSPAVQQPARSSLPCCYPVSSNFVFGPRPAHIPDIDASRPRPWTCLKVRISTHCRHEHGETSKEVSQRSQVKLEQSQAHLCLSDIKVSPIYPLADVISLKLGPILTDDINFLVAGSSSRRIEHVRQNPRNGRSSRRRLHIFATYFAKATKRSEDEI